MTADALTAVAWVLVGCVAAGLVCLAMLWWADRRVCRYYDQAGVHHPRQARPYDWAHEPHAHDERCRR